MSEQGIIDHIQEGCTALDGHTPVLIQYLQTAMQERDAARFAQAEAERQRDQLREAAIEPCNLGEAYQCVFCLAWAPERETIVHEGDCALLAEAPATADRGLDGVLPERFHE